MEHRKFLRGVAALLTLALLLGITACATPATSPATGASPTAGDTTTAATDTRTVLDQAGRTVELPAQVETAALIYGVATNFIIALGAGDRLIAINATWGFFNDIVPSLATAGTVGRGSVDYEALASYNPDVFIHKASDPQTLEAVTAMGIPAVGISPESTEDILQTMMLLGQVFGKEDRAAQLVAFYKDKVAFVEGKVADIAQDQRKSAILMGTELGKVAGGDMLQSYMLETAGAINCAKDTTSAQTWPSVGTEKIFEWDPDYIFCTNSNAAEYTVEDILNDPTWQDLTAVKNGHVYLVPSDTDSWEFPGMGSCLGIEWMMSKMYPDKYSEAQMFAQVDDFYQFVYGKTFSGEYLGY